MLSIYLDKESLSIDGLYLGPSKKAKIAMSEFLSKAPKPTSSKFIPQTFFDSVKEFSFLPENEVVNPKHHPRFFKSKSFLVEQGKGLTPQAISFILNFLNKVSCNTLAIFDLFDGTTNIVNVTSSFVYRNVLYGIQVMCYDQTNKKKLINALRI